MNLFEMLALAALVLLLLALSTGLGHILGIPPWTVALVILAACAPALKRGWWIVAPSAALGASAVLFVDLPWLAAPLATWLTFLILRRVGVWVHERRDPAGRA